MPPRALNRWWAGEWQPCSRSCGFKGVSRRAVLCLRSVGMEEQRALDPSACEHLPRPPAEIPCNPNVSCPATWAVGNWSQVSVRWEGSRPSWEAWSREEPHCLGPGEEPRRWKLCASPEASGTDSTVV